jgi:large subunit ribosomal protein L3
MLGLIGTKIGMVHMFNDDGNIIPTTIIKIEDNIVVRKKTVEKDGYNALIVGSFDVKENKLNKPEIGNFKKNNVPFKRVLKEFRVDDPSKYEIGQKIGLDIFDDVKFLDICGISKGKGYQGVMKRHGFSGGPKTHGSKFHRQNGSTGQNTFPARVFKGVKRAGRMGTDRVTVLNLKLHNLDKENNLIMVKGAVPGKNKSVVYINKAKKKK